MTPEQIEIAVVEGILNEDINHLRRLEREQKELEDMAQWLGSEKSSDMRIWERVANLNRMHTCRLHSFEWHCNRLESLREVKATA